jgi:hypothetical protein
MSDYLVVNLSEDAVIVVCRTFPEAQVQLAKYADKIAAGRTPAYPAQTLVICEIKHTYQLQVSHTLNSVTE